MGKRGRKGMVSNYAISFKQAAMNHQVHIKLPISYFVWLGVSQIKSMVSEIIEMFVQWALFGNNFAYTEKYSSQPL